MTRGLQMGRSVLLDSECFGLCPIKVVILLDYGRRNELMSARGGVTHLSIEPLVIKIATKKGRACGKTRIVGIAADRCIS